MVDVSASKMDRRLDRSSPARSQPPIVVHTQVFYRSSRSRSQSVPTTLMWDRGPPASSSSHAPAQAPHHPAPRRYSTLGRPPPAPLHLHRGHSRSRNCSGRLPPPPSPQPDSLLVGKNSRSRKQKLRELNNRPDHAGSDMDAFVDTADGPVAPRAAPAPAAAEPTPAAAAAEPQQEKVMPVKKEPSPAPLGEPVNHQPAAPLPAKEPVKESPAALEEEPPKKKETVDHLNEINKEQHGAIGTTDDRPSAAPAEEEGLEEEEEQQDDDDEGSSDKENDASAAGRREVELKYQYEDDQWSPLNQEGKKSYGRDFLMQFQPECLDKPDNLPMLEVILDAPIRSSEPGMRAPNIASPSDVFTPMYMKSSSGSKGPMGAIRSRSRQKDQRPPGKVISLPAQEVKLKRAEKAWKPGGKPTDDTNEEEMNIFRQVRAMLNKLTPQNFDALLPQFHQLDFTTESRLSGTIKIVFDKAISEPTFSKTYAELCKGLSQISVQGEKGQKVIFRNCLISHCQTMFMSSEDKEIDAEIEEKTKALEEAETEEKKAELKQEVEFLQIKARKRSLGNIRFIGELFKIGLLHERTMYECITKLLSAKDEESLECLCGLLTTIGKIIDKKEAAARVDDFMKRMETIINKRQISSRVRFMMQDVIDLRKNYWKPRREDKGPKKISEVHDEAEREKQEKAALIHSLPPQEKRGSRGGMPGRGSQGGPQLGPDGWNTVSKRQSAIEPGRMKLSMNKVQVSTDMQLGPGGRGGYSWAQGSSGGSKPSSREAEKPTLGNRFEALSGRGAETDPRGRGSSSRSSMPPPSNPKSGGRLSQGRETRGPNAARLSREKDREAALAAARNITRNSSSNRSLPGSRNQSRESSRNRERSKEPLTPTDVSRPPAPTQQRQANELSLEDIERKTVYLVKEYLEIKDMNEAIECVREIDSPSNHHKIIYFMLNEVIELSAKARADCAKLLTQLLLRSAIHPSKFIKGLCEILDYAEDFAVDIPNIWSYFGELIAPCITSDGLPFVSLKDICKPCLSCNKAHVLASAILSVMVKEKKEDWVANQWHKSKLTWESFMPPTEDLQDFLQRNKLEFLIEQGMPIGVIKSELMSLIKPSVSNEAIKQWIEDHVNPKQMKEFQFVRALMTAVCTSAIIEHESKKSLKEDALKDRIMLLQIYLDHNTDLELQALFALQAIMVSMEHPPGLLRHFFDLLYDEDLISEDSFMNWDKSNDATEAGKGMARLSVDQFYTWLREPAEEQEDI